MRIIKRYKKTTATAIGIIAVALCVDISMPKPLFTQPTSTVLTDRDGRLLGARIADDGQWRFAAKDSVPEKFRKCIIAYEDRRFYYHPGTDIIAIARAIKNDISKGRKAEGGSTLTMQIARMARGNQERTIWQKIMEMLWATDIELRNSKDDILKLYAAHAPMGGNVVGIEAAAWRYFGVAAEDLSWAESATLAVLPNSPSLINVGRNRDRLKTKRDRLLKKMYEDGDIAKEDYELAIEEPLPEKPYPLPDKAPHYLDYLSKGHKGERIATTIDIRLQEQTQQTANSYSKTYQSNYINNIAVLVLDARSGDVLAYIGNATDANTPSKHVDIVQSERSPGSLLKPILYASMLTQGEITPKMLISDTPLSIGGFAPHNFSKTYNGAVHADEAITRSLNVPLVRMLIEHNTGRFMETLKRLGMTTLHKTEDHYGASLILGGAEAKLWDMCHIYRKMMLTLSTYDPQKRVKEIMEGKESERDTTEIFSASAVWWTMEAMSRLNRPEEEADWQQFASMKRVAWKTGTSWGSRDGWAIGITPKYIVGVWVGNATGEGRAGLTGVGYAAPLMFDIYAHLDNTTWFDEPLDDMDEYIVCRKSGHIASNVCAETDTVRLPRRSRESEPCQYCHIINTTLDGKWRINSTCESTYNMLSESRFSLPPVMEYYYKQNHADYKPLPPYRADCTIGDYGTVKIIYPEAGSSIVVPKGFSGEKEKVIFRATTQREKATLFWHIDNQYICDTRNIHEIALPELEEGEHKLTIVDDRGENTWLTFKVK